MTRASQRGETCEEQGCTNTADWLVGSIELAEVNDLKLKCDDCHELGTARVERPFDPTLPDYAAPV